MMVINFKNILSMYVCCCCMIMNKKTRFSNLIILDCLIFFSFFYFYITIRLVDTHTYLSFIRNYIDQRFFCSSFNRYASKDFGRPHPTCGFSDGIIRRVGVGSACGWEADLWSGHQRSIMSTPWIREHGRVWTASDEWRRHGDRGRQEMAAWYDGN